MENKGPNRTESQAIYNLFSTYLTTNNIHIGDHIKPFAIHTGTTISLNNGKFVDDSNDGTGYVLASGGYAKYTFEVKAGKSYYAFFSRMDEEFASVTEQIRQYYDNANGSLLIGHLEWLEISSGITNALKLVREENPKLHFVIEKHPQMELNEMF